MLHLGERVVAGADHRHPGVGGGLEHLVLGVARADVAELEAVAAEDLVERLARRAALVDPVFVLDGPGERDVALRRAEVVALLVVLGARETVVLAVAVETDHRAVGGQVQLQVLHRDPAAGVLPRQLLAQSGAERICK